MKQISYADNILLKSLCNNLSSYLEQKKDPAFPKERIEAYINKIKSRANGYWQLSEGKSIFLDALNVICDLLKNNATPSEMNAVYYEFTNVMANVSKKCRVTFLAQEYAVWPSLCGVYDAMLKDNSFEVKVVYVPFHHPNLKINDNNLDSYRADNVPIITHEKYSLSEDNPDIVFFAKPYNLIPQQYIINEVEKLIDKTVYIPYGMEANYKLVFYGFQHYLHYRVWRHIVYGQYVKQVGKKYGYRNGENIVVWGHPKMDYFLNGRKVAIPNDWLQKINGRRVVCWCPHHTILPGKEHVSTWLDYQEIIFDWIKKHPEIVLLWRPHPLLFGALVNNKYMTQGQLDEFLEEKKNQDNIIFDDYSDYHAAFEISDAMITDGTSFSIEYLGTGKPLMLTTSDISQYYNYKEAQKGLYIGDSSNSVIKFLENMSMDKDPKKLARKEYTKKTVFLPNNKTISEYITDNILHDLVDEQKLLAERLCK